MVLLFAFVVIVVVEDLANPGLSPATHQISEYVHTPSGWLMTAGFAAWAASLALTAESTRTASHSKTGPRLIRALLIAAAAGFVVTAAFATQTVAGQIPVGHRLTDTGRLHDIGSGLSSLALFGAALITASSKSYVKWLRGCAAGLVATAVVSDVALLVVGPSVGGIRQRVLVGVGCLWQAQFLAAQIFV